MVLRCDLCRIEVPDGLFDELWSAGMTFFFVEERVLVDHTNGKRHQALLTARERFENSQNASVFVSRIKPEHTEELLKGYFVQFGAIKNCFVDKEKVSLHACVHRWNLVSLCLRSTSMRSLNTSTLNQRRNAWSRPVNISCRMEHDWKSNNAINKNSKPNEC